MAVEQLKVEDFTTEALDGTGVFDAFMRSTKSHIAEEYNKGRIKGPEYATVYLSALNATADRALEFLLRKDEQFLKNKLIEVQVEQAELEKEKIQAEILLVNAQVDKVNAEVLLVQAQIEKMQQERDLIEAQKDKLRAEIVLISGQLDKIQAEVANIEANTALTGQQVTNAQIEAQVLTATKCKLEAEFDMIVKQIEKIGSEISLLTQRTNTEKAQTIGSVIGHDSILGTQRDLYKRQAEGFLRDAEQKAAKMLIDTWNVRRTTDEGTAATSTSGLQDQNIGRAVNKLLSGVNA